MKGKLISAKSAFSNAAVAKSTVMLLQPVVYARPHSIDAAEAAKL
jgi:hypothetical protein